MAGVSASRLDVEWDRGADHDLIVGRRTRSDTVLPLSSAALEVRPIDGPSSVPALVTVPGDITDEGRALFRVRAEHLAELPRAQYEHRVRAVDAASDQRLVLVRGYVSIVDSRGGDT